MTSTPTPDQLRTLASKWQAEAAPLVHHGSEYDGAEEEANDRMADVLTQCADALLVLIGEREDSTSASRQHYIDTGEHLAPADHEMSPCGHPEDMCASPGCCTTCNRPLAWDGRGGYAHT